MTDSFSSYRAWALTHRQAPGTVEKSVRYLRFFARERELDLEPATLSQERVIQFLARWRLAGVKPRTLNSWVRELNLWSRFNELGWRMEYFRHHDVPKIQVPTREIVDQLRALRWPNPTVNARNHAILALLCDMGPRRQEIVSLQVRDVIDTADGPAVVVRHGKGEKERILWIDPSTRDLIRTYVDRYRIRSHAVALFTTPIGKVSYGYLGRLVQEMGASVGAPWLSCHKLRHYVTDQLLDAGVSVPSVAEVLGHARWETTALYRSKRLAKVRAELEIRGASRTRFGPPTQGRKEGEMRVKPERSVTERASQTESSTGRDGSRGKRSEGGASAGLHHSPRFLIMPSEGWN